MIKIKYENGEMNIDIVEFIDRRPIKDIKFLCKKVIKISYDRREIANEIIAICEKEINVEKKKLQTMVDEGYKKWRLNEPVRSVKKYRRCIEFLKPYTE